MILFKACPRCGGDVDTSHADDIRCLQCAHRPGDEIVASMMRPQAPADGGHHCTCPRCESTAIVLLDRLREGDNYCYRCRPCGHVFSPAAGSTA